MIILSSFYRCALAEMFTDGRPPFDLSQLLAYRNGEYDPNPHIDTIDDKEIRVCKINLVIIYKHLKYFILFVILGSH